jgi:hypothetical protein
MKTTDRSARLIATRATNLFSYDAHRYGNGANAYFEADGSIFLTTTAAGGDNVPWATNLFNHVAAAFRRHGYQVDWPTHRHGCGNVSATLRRV